MFHSIKEKNTTISEVLVNKSLVEEVVKLSTLSADGG